MRFPIVSAGILALVTAGLVFGQTAPKMPPGTKVQIQEQKAGTVNTALKDKIAKMPLVKFDDGLQCLLKHKSEMTAAYAEAANAGCTKVKVDQATLYDCGPYNSIEGTKCNAAKAKIDALIKNCGLKEPVFKDIPPTPPNPNADPNDPVFLNDPWVATPGCNSLGITCMVHPD